MSKGGREWGREGKRGREKHRFPTRNQTLELPVYSNYLSHTSQGSLLNSLPCSEGKHDLIAQQCLLSGCVPGTQLGTSFTRPSQQLREVVAVKNILVIQMGKPRHREVTFPRLSWQPDSTANAFHHPSPHQLLGLGGVGGKVGLGGQTPPSPTYSSATSIFYLYSEFHKAMKLMVCWEWRREEVEHISPLPVNPFLI